MMPEDYYSVLANVIIDSTQDGTQLRKMIYEMSRIKLRRQLFLQFHHLGRAEMLRQMLELETAIERIELTASQNLPLLTFSDSQSKDKRTPDEPVSTDLVVQPPASAAAAALGAKFADVLAPETYTPVQRIEPAQPLPPIQQYDTEFRPTWHFDAVPRRRWFKFQIAAAVLIGITIYGVIDRQNIINLTGWHVVRDAPKQVVKADQPTDTTKTATRRPPTPDIPIPVNYGIYAVDGGKLTELEALPIRVPDPRVAISGVISTPSPTTLPNGKLEFVVFRRDLRNNAPDAVSVRVIAQVMHALTFTGGKAVVSGVQDAWAVRNNSYAMRVAPVEGNPEMIVIRPQTADFVFPAGRYALAFKTLAYDFTVAGPITDPAHCLERTDALDNPIFSECRTPPDRH